MTDEQITQSFLKMGRRCCMDYLIEAHEGTAQFINMQCLAYTDLEIAEWCKDVAKNLKESRTTA